MLLGGKRLLMKNSELHTYSSLRAFPSPLWPILFFFFSWKNWKNEGHEKNKIKITFFGADFIDKVRNW
jgi:hypothetical protein